MRKRLLAMLLCIAMLAVLFAGCGSETASVEETASSAEVVSEAPEAPAEEPAADAPAEEAPAEEPVASIQYPVSDGETYSIAVVMDGTLLDYVPGGDPANASGIALMQEKTGIKFDYTVFAMMSDNMTLMIAGGDWTDIITKINEHYSTGLTGALADDVIMDLAPYVEENAPDYYALLNSDENFIKSAYTEEGMLPAFYTMNPASATASNGWGIRMDYLEEVGINEVPVTFDDLEKAAEAVLAKHPEMLCAVPLASSFISEGYESELMYGYGLNTINYEFFVNEEGAVDYAWTTDNARDYLEMIARWVDKDIVDKDTMISGDVSSFGNSVYLGETLMKHGGTDLWGNEYLDMAEAPDFNLAPMKELVKAEGDVIPFGGGAASVSTGWSITTTCENVETLIQAANWIYTEEGSIAMNFGIENESFTIDEEGGYHYSDLVMNNPDGVPMFMATGIYTGFEVPKYTMPETVPAKLSNDQQYAALEYLSDQNLSTAGVRYGTLNEAETEAIAGLADIDTYVRENIMAFATGEVEITDDSWAEFVSTIESMGIAEITACYQAAHDRYVG